MDERRAPVQGDGNWTMRPDDPRREGAHVPGTMAWEEHLEVFEAYAARYGRRQSAERIAERGGFGYSEAETLLGRPLRTWRPG